MKKRIFSRVLSFLLVLAMVLEFVPMAAIETQAANDAVTDLNIQFDYREETGIQNADAELTNEANKIHQEVKNSTTIVWPSNGEIFTDVKDGDFKCKDGGKFRTLLESKDTEYIRLVDDLKATSSHDDYDVINITADKVIDLNGHTIELYDKRNKIDTAGEVGESYDQSTTPSDHMSYMFEIDNGATLTIIDSQGKAYNPNATAKTGRIYANAMMINHQIWDFLYYTHRDIFLVSNGNLVIHGGEFQAGRQKDQYKSGFSWDKLKEVVGQAVDFGTSIFEYTTGIQAAQAAKADLEKKYYDLEEAEKKAMEADAAEQDAPADGTSKKKTGNDDSVAKDQKTETPASAGAGDDAAKKNQTIAQKQEDKNNNKNDAQNNRGDQNEDNQANDDKTAKYEKNTKLAEKEKAIGDAALDKTKISSMVDTAFELGKGLYEICSSQFETRATACIQGTVAQVQNGGTLVVYGGKFIGHGSTPNVRNAVIEVEKTVQKYPSTSAHAGKYVGGMAYIYGGTFEAYTGANVFNMVKGNANGQTATMRVKDADGKITTETITLAQSETFGQEPLMFEEGAEWDEWAAGWKKLKTDAEKAEYPQPPRVSTANVVVRGGTFRCYYELSNMAILKDKQEGLTDPPDSDDDYDHRKFSGTPGSVNLGVESFGKDMIRDGRIQLVDVYGQGSLVLLDGGEPIRKATSDNGETNSDNTLEGNDYQTEGGFRHYRLFIGDSELRAISYLHAYPNEAQTNSTFSFNLATYWGQGDEQVKLWESDDENKRAPYSSNEKYFDFIYDDIQANNAGITPTYYVKPEMDGITHPTDVDLQKSSVWYYNTPLDTDGNPIQDISYGTIYEVGKNSNNQKLYNAIADEYYRTNIKWFTYKVYRVDPLTRENISESKTYGVDEPLIEVVYGAKNDSLKCKLDLVDIAEEIKNRRGTSYWNGFKSGEMYRIEFSVEEKLGTGYQGSGKFLNDFEAKSTSSILFLCSSKNEQKDQKYQDPETGEWKDRFGPDFTPMQFAKDTIAAGENATVQMVNGQTGMVDYEGARIFDVYYQWYEVDKDGSNPRLIAGTDNVWISQGADTKKMQHYPKNWKIKANGQGINGEQYYNTVDPSDPKAASYGKNGLPTTTDQWTYDMLHMYTQETVGKHDGMKIDQNDKLYIENNNTFWKNTDTCYIPENLAGKYIQVKAVVVNCRYYTIYDNLQTFTSHVMKVADPIDEICVKLDAPREGQKPDFTPEFPAGAKYSQGQNPIWEVYDKTTKKYVTMTANETFKAGNVYRVIVDVDAASGETFSANCDYYINGESVMGFQGYTFLNPTTGKKCEGRQLTSALFSVPLEIDEVFIELDEPVAGQTPDYSPTLPFGATYKVADDYCDYVWYYGNVCWYEITENGQWSEMSRTDTFEAGKRYVVEVVLGAWNGTFSHQNTNSFVYAYVNGEQTDQCYEPYGENVAEYIIVPGYFTAKEAPEAEGVITRIAGANRNETSYKVADVYKDKLGVDQFDAAIIATSRNFADALAGSYLSVVKKAPILLTNGKADNIAVVHQYIEENVKHGGTIYILGGEAAVSEDVENILGYEVKRLAGELRYDTNIEILKEAGIAGTELIVATGKNFADSLSASAVKKPILLVKPGAALSSAQKDIVKKVEGGTIYIVGGEEAVPKATATELKAYGTVYRISGESRYDTSVAVAEQFFGTTENAVVASGKTFPDGLCGGPLAAAIDAPLVLTADGKTVAAEKYVRANAIESGFVLGGTEALSDKTVIDIFSLSGSEDILTK